MAEDVLRYRLEIDPRQADGELSRVRSAIGQTLTNVQAGASYGASLVPGAYNSIRSDLAYTANTIGGTIGGFASIPFRHRPLRTYAEFSEEMSQRMTVGLGEAALGAAGVALPAGSVMTGLGVAGALAATGIGIPASGLVLAGTLAYGASSVASSAGMAVGERALSDIQANFDVQRQLMQRGMGLVESRSVAGEIIRGGRRQLFSGAETAGLFESTMESGALQQFMSDPEAVGRRMTETARTARRIMSSLRLSLGETAQEMNAMYQMGVNLPDVATALVNERATATAAGVSTGMMRSAGQMGANLAVGMGMRGVTGMGMMQQGMIAGGIAGAQMDPAIYNMMGGQQGIAQMMARSQANFMQGPMANMMLMGGMSGVNRFNAGGGFMEGMLATAGDIAQGGPMGGITAMFRASDTRAKLSATQVAGMNTMAAMNIAQMMPGTNADMEERLAVAFGMTNNIDISTNEGLNQARVLAREAMSPASTIRGLIGQNREAARIRDSSLALGTMKDRAMRLAYESTIGRAGGAIGDWINNKRIWVEESTRSTANQARRWFAGFGEGNAGFAGKLFRDVGLGVLGSSYHLRAVSGGRDETAATFAFLKSTTGKNASDIIKGVIGSSEEVEAFGFLEDSYRVGEITDKETYNRAFAEIETNEGLRKSLQGASDANRLAAVQKALGIDITDTDAMNAIGQALRQTGFAPTRADSRTRFQEVAERNLGLAGEMLGKLKMGQTAAAGDTMMSPTARASMTRVFEAISKSEDTKDRVRAASGVAAFLSAENAGQRGEALQRLQKVFGDDYEKIRGDLVSIQKDSGQARAVQEALKPGLEAATTSTTAILSALIGPRAAAKLAKSDKQLFEAFGALAGRDIEVGAMAGGGAAIGGAEEVGTQNALQAIQNTAGQQINQMEAIAVMLDSLTTRLGR